VSVWSEAAESLPPFARSLQASLGVTVELFVVLMAMSMLYGRYVNWSAFSMQSLYHTRIVRAFLGAARRPQERHADPLTDYDEDDNMPIGELRSARPLHVVNVAVNLAPLNQGAGPRGVVQPFTISPLHAGSARLGYRRTSRGPAQTRLQEAVDRVRDCAAAHSSAVTSRCHRDATALAPRLFGGWNGIAVGTAMTISGPTASPSIGYYATRGTALLTTLFNLRLGWWLGNPGPSGEETFFLNSPTDPVRPLVDELFGNQDERRPYVHLTDGGHFDNLGLFEMVRRRCRFILVSDATSDPRATFTDLGNALRRVRVELGIPIEFEPGSFNIKGRSSSADEPAGEYFAVARIGYSAADASPRLPGGEAGAMYDGVLLYVKPCFYGDEPRDVYEYGSSHGDFPHEAVADQWLSDAQFESYRSLGEHIGHRVFRDERMLDLMRGIYAGDRPRAQAQPSAPA
jgi:hypothetical protein